jgi:hypothetical protein
MILFLAGDLHGRITEFYDKVRDLEKSLGAIPDWILQTGNFGVFPDPARKRRTSKKNNNPDDFAKMYLDRVGVPYKTLFVAGRHEDHRWLEFKLHKQETEILPNLYWLVNGYSTRIGNQDESLSILGLGKVYSPPVFHGQPVAEKKKQGRYTRGEIEKACSAGPVDMVLAHQAPKGERFGNILSDSEGLANTCFATRPTLYVHGHYNHSREYSISRTISGLSLAALEIVPVEFSNGVFIRLM